eukprot:NODE_21946_length_729_cov_3.808970.p4 GENE.NODE_21946_length_729_cov_3.808970~~NODE_21946_length_729_cov_3.808970.p4  ORF type:complete len:50 (+),score=1.01 NODE_21946_length_729_cov_3.808970:232-381(+)
MLELGALRLAPSASSRPPRPRWHGDPSETLKAEGAERACPFACMCACVV